MVVQVQRLPTAVRKVSSSMFQECSRRLKKAREGLIEWQCTDKTDRNTNTVHCNLEENYKQTLIP